VECSVQVLVACLSKEGYQFGVDLRRPQILRDPNNATLQTVVCIGSKVLIVMRYND
jgi:hypothetical protein